MFDDFFVKAQELREQGVPFATATVVRAERPTSGKPGDKAIVTLDGVMYGWVGGSCAQPTVILEARRALADDRCRLVRLTPDPDAEGKPEGIEVCRMTCYSGGTLDVYIEPQPPRAQLRIAGHLPVAQALAHLGKAMGYRVLAVVPPGEGSSMAHADEVTSEPQAMARPATPLTFVVVATHGNGDEQAIEEALGSGASYIGLVASPKRSEAVLRYLKLRGLKGDDLSALKVPAGLDIGARRGDEIALSIMAEIVQRRRSLEQLDWSALSDESAAGESQGSASEATAIDPICGMTVVKEGATFVHEHEGESYYFCCGGCLTTFAEQPEKYVTAQSSSA